jgi:hypothetical protein
LPLQILRAFRSNPLRRAASEFAFCKFATSPPCARLAATSPAPGDNRAFLSAKDCLKKMPRNGRWFHYFYIGTVPEATGLLNNSIKKVMERHLITGL